MREDASERLRRAAEHRESGRAEEAGREYRAVLGRWPDHAGALEGLATLLREEGRGAEAVMLLERAAARRPGSAAIAGALADALHAGGELSRAVDEYRRALGLEPDRSQAWWGLGCALASLGDHAGAVAAFRSLTALQPEHGLALTNLGKSLFELGEVDAAVEAFRAAIARLGDGLAAVPLVNVATIIPGASGANIAGILEARRAFAATLGPAADAPPAAVVEGRPIRLGYVSAFLSRRNWMKPVWSLLRHHDRERFEVHLYSDGAEAAPEAGYARDPRDRFHDVSRFGNDDLARRIRRDGIDVLVDLNAYSRPGRLPLFLLRPAPVQVAWFNMFGTSGMPGAFDYLIGDRYVAPPGEDPFYTERVVRLEGSYLTFDVPYATPDVASPPWGRTGSLTFGCLAPLYKLTPEVLESWALILQGSPGTGLYLRNGAFGERTTREHVVRAFARHGIGPDRLELEGPAEHFRFLEAYGEFDVALDSFPYNGGTTTMEALWQGVPVLTFAGDRWASRISASLLGEAGLEEWVVADREAYVERAIALAADPATPGRLAELRRGMRDRLRGSSACDVEGFARRMEAAYLAMLGQ